MKLSVFFLLLIFICVSCSGDKKSDPFYKKIDQFEDVKILRYKVDGFKDLTLKQKTLIYYLSQAAIAGRDIIFDQNGKYNLEIRKIIDAIVGSSEVDKSSSQYGEFLKYSKRVWFANGIHHHYSSDKFVPKFSAQYLKEQMKVAKIELSAGKWQILKRVIFDPTVLPKKVSKDSSTDIVMNSSVNFYEGVTQKEVDELYQQKLIKNDPRPLSYGLNSKVFKEQGVVYEKVYSSYGMYGAAIKQIVIWLTKASEVAENKQQEEVIKTLVLYFKTGELKLWDKYNVLWVKDVSSVVDFINGFVETYEDPLGRKATFESIVNFKNIKASKRTELISGSAQWFEDNAPIDKRFKKKKVKGITAKVITVAQLAGDAYPATPIGVNLPNANWIRKEHGSKSVTLENITYAYDQDGLSSGLVEEFAYDDDEVELIRKYGRVTGNIHTDLHECIGHGSGKLAPGVTGDELKNYSSAMEETRADLNALYFIADEKLLDLEVLPDSDAYKAEYIHYIRNGIMAQLVRIKPGKSIEQSHMRNRQLIAKWAFALGKKDDVIEFKKKNGKSYVVVNDFSKLRKIFAQQLKEVQRIKSTGDFAKAKELIETYAVNVDQDLHKEVLERYAKLKIAPYTGFINPIISLVEENEKIVDVKVSYPENYTEQMLNYGKDHSFL